ncbi:MAG: NAD(P)H-dependent oxidoreductase [Rhizobacter sp.]|nr:NAD(P)H-dependent oxidoreductase [Chlorobiales bacterium]
MGNESDTRRFLFVLGSARMGGNTELLTRHAATLLPASAQQQWLRLIELPLAPFEDRRHSTGVYAAPSGNEEILFDATLGATDIVIASPLYWYSMSASTKLYLDYWSGWMRVPDTEFRNRMADKTLWVVSAVSDEDITQMSRPLVDTLKFTAEYLKMTWGGALLGFGNRPKDILSDARALAAAETFFLQRNGDKTKEDINP